MWSTIKDLKHYEQVEIEDACIEYHNRVQYFNQQIGVKYFYVFVRCTYNYGPEPPWKQWTLVAEVALESTEDLDKEIVISKLTNSIRNRITQYTSWFRPDLIHVKPKRRRYQARFEPELEFIGELKKIFYQSAGESDEADSYYGKFCHILGEDVNASAEEISSKFEAASEDVKLACLEHLLTQHPIELLHYIPYPRRSIWSAQQPSREGDSVKSSRISMNNESIAENDNDPDDDHSDNDELEGEEAGNMAQYENWDDLDDDEIESRLNRGADDLSDDEPQGMDSSELEEDVIDSDDNGDMRIGDQGRGLPIENSFLKAAARPYTYVNFVREMAVLHEIILERKRRKRSKMTVLE
ncbi:hypothetical protein KP509_09G094800 [Ceratopteris richardii]|nr:hypothetical protein KP509_09G094800 [Ceratopteris richardii]